MAPSLSRESLLSIFRETGALLEGHFQLTSGLHSSQYFQCAKVLQYPRHLQALARDLAKHFERDAIDVVLSPAIGGIVVGTEVGRVLGVRTIFAERKEGKMELRRGFDLRPAERILVVEDVVTTGGSVSEVITLVQDLGAIPAGVGSVVDRSNGKVTFEPKQVSLLQLEVVAWQPSECPLCREGNAVVKPGSRGNF
jgi:orotate phosphoribosyltransferase